MTAAWNATQRLAQRFRPRLRESTHLGQGVVLPAGSLSRLLDDEGDKHEGAVADASGDLPAASVGKITPLAWKPVEP